MKYFNAVHRLVKEEVSANLPERFGLIFNGWSAGTHHYVGVFAVYPEGMEMKRKKVMLAMDTLLDETNQNAANHVEFLVDVLQSYNKSLENVLFICGDNCNTNKNIADRLHVPLIGCRSHIFNLAVNHFLSTFKDLVDKIDKLCGKLRNRNAADKLRQLGCTIEAVSRNVTRWSSTYMMLKRYRELNKYINKTNFPELIDYLLTPLDVASLEGLLSIMEKLQTVTEALQRDNITLRNVQALFDATSELLSDSDTYLARDAKMLHSPVYYSAILK